MSNRNKEDIFARIATDRLAQRSERLEEQQPPAVPDRVLPLDEHPGKSILRPRPRIDTAEKLNRELKRRRERMGKYLRNLAPASDTLRQVKPLSDFDWREETEDDRRDFAGHTLAGKGDWARVRIPHYGPPLGRAATYYRTSLRVTRAMARAGSLWLCFEGVDYRAHVFFNGAYVGSHEGFFAAFECDVTAHAHVGENTLLVKVENDVPTLKDGDKIYAATGPGYDEPQEGWHHCPAGMGIYQPVRFEARAKSFIRELAVLPLDLEGNTEIRVDVFGTEADLKDVAFEISVYGRNFKAQPIRRFRHEPVTTQIRGHGDLDQFNDSAVPQQAGRGVNNYRIPIQIPKPRLWDLDSPWLYQLQVRLLEDANMVDAAECQFGIRTFEQDESSSPKGRFLLNGREIRLRGANTMGHLQQCVMRGADTQLTDDILLAKLANMNFLRLTQRPVQKEIYERCDQLGLMTQTDLPLFGKLRRNQTIEAVRQAGEMEHLLRGHPGAVLVSFINEPFPNATGQPHRHLTRDELHMFFEMAAKAVRMENPHRAIKCCDGDYDPPAPFGMPDNHCYCGWYIGHGLDLGKLNRGYWIPVKKGWYYGCGEYGAEGLDNYEVMKKYYPHDWLPEKKDLDARWSPDRISMAQTQGFHYLWYETPQTLREWIRASHAHQAWVVRMMTEAFRRDSRMNSFAVHLFIDAWPAGWMKTLMDVDRQPKQAFFEFRDALTPLMVSLRTDRTAYHSGETIEMEAWICNDTNEIPEGAKLHYWMQGQNSTLAAGRVKPDIPKCSSVGQGMLEFKAPKVDARSQVAVHLALADSCNKILHQTSKTVDVFPISRTQPRRRINVLGGKEDLAYRLADELGMGFSLNAAIKREDTLLISDPACYQSRKQEIDQAVEDGAVAIFFELPVGSYLLGGAKLDVQECGMGKRHFVACNTNHPLVGGFQSEDFKFWYDSAAGYATPILDTVLSCEGWETILTSGNGDWQGVWKACPAAVEKNTGKGAYRVAQVKLKNRLQQNPVAIKFMLCLIGE